MNEGSLSATELLNRQAHRRWPAPKRPWLMLQVWRDLLFAHWTVPVDAIRPLVPRQLELDTFDGHAWLSITPFHMSVRVRGLPHLPGMFDVPELNCRTYVVADEKPGVFFFSLDAASRIVVSGARVLYHLPYFGAKMRYDRDGDTISYSSVRQQARWRAKYRPTAQPHIATPGSAEYFLAERYCLYTVWNEQVYRGEIHHVPWPLQDAAVNIEENTIAESAGVTLTRPPDHLSFARELKVLIWPLAPINV
jgi:uncharacterized protein